MKISVILFFFLFIQNFFLTKVTNAQGNLVPNPSFEDTIACPESTGQIYDCAEWHSAGEPFLTSPDYFNSCSTSPNISVPDVAWGYQEAHSGNAYSFVATYVDFAPYDRRETIQATLSQSLSIGQKYFVSFYADLGGRGGVSIATNKLGALFTTYLFTPTNFCVPHNLAQVYTDLVLTDTINWYHFSDSFVADSSYEYITIGNFFDDAHTDTIVLHVGFPNAGGYFIDDVCVSTDSTLCYYTIGMNNYSEKSNIRIFPNPSSAALNIVGSNPLKSIQIYDYLGRTVRNLVAVKSNEVSINCSSWSEGIYFLKIDNNLFKQLIIH